MLADPSGNIADEYFELVAKVRDSAQVLLTGFYQPFLERLYSIVLGSIYALDATAVRAWISEALVEAVSNADKSQLGILKGRVLAGINVGESYVDGIPVMAIRLPLYESSGLSGPAFQAASNALDDIMAALRSRFTLLFSRSMHVEKQILKYTQVIADETGRTVEDVIPGRFISAASATCAKCAAELTKEGLIGVYYDSGQVKVMGGNILLDNLTLTDIADIAPDVAP